MKVHLFLYGCFSMAHLSAVTISRSSRWWSHRMSRSLCATTVMELFIPDPNNIFNVKLELFLRFCRMCVCVNYWPPVKTVSTHLRGPKWALSGWHSAGLVSVLPWHRFLPVFHHHLLPVSGQTALRGQMSRLLLEIKGRCAVFTMHLTDRLHCLYIVV